MKRKVERKKKKKEKRVGNKNGCRLRWKNNHWWRKENEKENKEKETNVKKKKKQGRDRRWKRTIKDWIKGKEEETTKEKRR